MFFAPFHPSADECGSGVEDGHAILFDNFKDSSLVWCIRSSFIHHLCCAVDQWPIDHVGVASNPSNIGCAPIDIAARFNIKDCFMCVGNLSEIPARCVEDTLWFCCSPRCIQNKERVLTIEELRCVSRWLAINNLMPPNITTIIPRCLLTRAPNN